MVDKVDSKMVVAPLPALPMESWVGCLPAWARHPGKLLAGGEGRLSQNTPGKSALCSSPKSWARFH